MAQGDRQNSTGRWSTNLACSADGAPPGASPAGRGWRRGDWAVDVRWRLLSEMTKRRMAGLLAAMIALSSGVNGFLAYVVHCSIMWPAAAHVQSPTVSFFIIGHSRIAVA